MYVARHMTRNPVTVQPDILVPEARALLRSHHFRHLPVTDEEGHLRGMVTDRDIRSAYPSTVLSEDEAREELEKLGRTPVSAIMSRDPVALCPHSTLDDGLLVLQEQKVGALPVVNEDGVVVGIFSIRDLIKAYSKIFGLGERGSSLIAIEDDGQPGILGRIVKILEEGGIPFTRLVRVEGAEAGLPGVVYVRVQTYNINRVHAALEGAGLRLVGPDILPIRDEHP